MASSSTLSCREWMLSAVAGFLGAALATAIAYLLSQPCSFGYFKTFWPLSSLLREACDPTLKNTFGWSGGQRRKPNSTKGLKANSDCKCGRSQIRDRALNGTISARQDAELFSNTVPRKTDLLNGCVKADPFDTSKREGYLSWDDYFMAIAFLSAHRSKDPNRQVGACLVSQDRVILGIGYNGFPRGCSDDLLPWAKISINGDPLQTKYPYVCHAEVNAILNKNHASASGQRLYVTMFPCNECAKIIIQAGVAEVVYFIDKKGSSSDYSYTASQRLLSMAGVKVWQHQPAQQKIVVEFK